MPVLCAVLVAAHTVSSIAPTVAQGWTDILRCLTRVMKMMSNKEPSAMDCWHFIAPIIPITDDYSQSVYVKTFQAFKLLEEEEKKKNGSNSD